MEILKFKHNFGKFELHYYNLIYNQTSECNKDYKASTKNSYVMLLSIA